MRISKTEILRSQLVKAEAIIDLFVSTHEDKYKPATNDDRDRTAYDEVYDAAREAGYAD